MRLLHWKVWNCDIAWLDPQPSRQVKHVTASKGTSDLNLDGLSAINQAKLPSENMARAIGQPINGARGRGGGYQGNARQTWSALESSCLIVWGRRKGALLVCGNESLRADLFPSCSKPQEYILRYWHRIMGSS